MDDIDEKRYIIVDFQGYIKWTRLRDGSFAVDPLFEEEFLLVLFNP
jgi:hypothetical protein